MSRIHVPTQRLVVIQDCGFGKRLIHCKLGKNSNRPRKLSNRRQCRATGHTESPSYSLSPGSFCERVAALNAFCYYLVQNHQRRTLKDDSQCQLEIQFHWSISIRSFVVFQGGAVDALSNFVHLASDQICLPSLQYWLVNRPIMFWPPKISFRQFLRKITFHWLLKSPKMWEASIFSTNRLSAVNHGRIQEWPIIPLS